MTKIKDKIRSYFIAGVLTIVPLSLTFYVVNILFGKADRILNLVPAPYNPKTYIPFPLPGLGIVLVLLATLLIGILVENYVGGRIVSFGEKIVHRIPLVRPIYSSTKQLLIAVFSSSPQSFKQVVLVEYPRRGLYSLGFVTGVTEGEIQEAIRERVINVFLPTTPNPTTGLFLMVPEKEMIPLQMKVEDAFKLIISGGLVTPGNTKRPPSSNKMTISGNAMSYDEKMLSLKNSPASFNKEIQHTIFGKDLKHVG